MTKTNFELSQKSKNAIKEIYKHTVKNFGEEQAIVYTKGMYETFNTLTEHPNIGQDISEYKQGLRKFRYRSHIILYQNTNNKIQIYLVLHTKQDLRKHILEN